jgi:transposase InsO family protein
MKSKDSQTGSGRLHTARRAWPPEVRLQMAEAIVNRGVGVSTLSEAFGISPNTLMEWAQRYRKHGPDGVSGVIATREAKNREGGQRGRVDRRREAVISAKREHPDQGTRRIRDVLERFEGMGVSETTIRRILHEEGLLEGVPDLVDKPALERRFERAEPNQLWQSDIFTFLLRRHERLYVAAFMDDYSRYLVSLVIAHHQRSSLVMEALTRGIADYGAPREVLTDQGRQYVAWRGHTEFEEELRRQGIHHVKSRPHHPETLGKIERFWKTLWDEFLSRTVFADFGDCQRRVMLFVQAYNFRRPHQGIEGLVPADRFFRAAPQVREAIEKGVATNAMALAHERPQAKPFYLVGRLGDQDLSIALSGSGLLIKLGDREQTIGLRKEEEDEGSRTAQRTSEAPAGAPDPQMDLEIGGARSGGESPVSDGAERAVRGEAGDRGDRGGRDFAGDVLPAGNTSSERHAASAFSDGDRGELGGGQPGEEDCAARGEGEEARTGTAPIGTAPGPDSEGGEGRDGSTPGPENQLEREWQDSFARLEERRDEAFDADSEWRGRAVTWERKLAGADERRDEEELHTGSPGALLAPAPLQGGHGGPGRGADGERRGAPSGSFAKPLPDADAPGASWASGSSGEQEGRSTQDSGEGEEAPRGERPSAPRERALAQTGGDDRPAAGRGEGFLERSDGSEGEEE